ncbi:hypothetical protein HDV00_000199 [Rhizophlyctis rosea]|nr:hypothetical protein HDV00_000199 [Rhizophlyctis rosea]
MNEIRNLEKLTDAVTTGDSQAIAEEMRAISAPNAMLEDKIREGLLKIKEFDTLLHEKQRLAKRLKKSRLSRESSASSNRTSTTTEPSEGTEISTPQEFEISDDEPDTESVDMELKSVHSLDTRTFITEPKLAVRTRVGIQNLIGGEGARGVHGAARSAEVEDSEMIMTDGELQPASKKRKGYVVGNFIERNKVLGRDARFYHAMSEQEQDRVEAILAVEDEPDMDAFLESPDQSRSTTPHVTDSRPFTSATAYFPDEHDYKRLLEIDR